MSGARVPKAYLESTPNFVCEWSAPNRLSTFTSSRWVTRLNHKPFDISVSHILLSCQLERSVTCRGERCTGGISNHHKLRMRQVLGSSVNLEKKGVSGVCKRGKEGEKESSKVPPQFLELLHKTLRSARLNTITSAISFRQQCRGRERLALISP